MRRASLALLAWCATGCAEHDCDYEAAGTVDLSGTVTMTIANGAETFPPVLAHLTALRYIDGYWVEDRSGEDSGPGHCETFDTAPLDGTATVIPSNDQATALTHAGPGIFRASTTYAQSYTFALREPSGEDHEVTVPMPAPFMLTLGTDGDPLIEFANATSTGIPDAQPAGVTITIPVSGVQRALALAITVDISHTARGDLVLDLLKDGAPVKTLWMNMDGLADNLRQTFELTASEIGTAVNGVWALRVVDTKAMDTGVINSVTLAFTRDVDVRISSPAALGSNESASIQVYSCQAQRTVSYPAPTVVGPSAWTIPKSALDPATNYRFTVTRRSPVDQSSYGSYATYVDFVTPYGVACP